eukprot:COSAG04_NODE_10166_length_799_cov_1.865714_1_plen_83_part_00
MFSALATPHTATRPSSLSSSFGLPSPLLFMFMLFFWLVWLLRLVSLGFAFCSDRLWLFGFLSACTPASQPDQPALGSAGAAT